MIIFKYFAIILPTVIFDTVLSFTDPRFIDTESLNIEDWLIPPRVYNADDSKCESNSQCEAAAREECRGNQECLNQVTEDINNTNIEDVKTKLTKCGLVEVYQVTSIGVTPFVQTQRHKQCVPSHQCNKQRTDRISRSAKLFIFCDEVLEERLDGKINLNAQMYNAAISERQCMGPSSTTGLNNKVGEPCTKGSTDPNTALQGEETVGICTMLQTQAMMDNDMRFYQPFQRQTLQMICERKSAASDGGLLDRTRVFFMNDLKVKFCNKYTSQLDNTVNPFDVGPCPIVDVMSVVQYLNNPHEASSILWDVQKYYEAAGLRLFFYWPLFLLIVFACLLLVIACIAELVYQIKEAIQLRIRRKKMARLFSPKDLERMEKQNIELAEMNSKAHTRDAIPKFDDDATDDEAGKIRRKPKKMEIDIDLEDVRWDFKSFREWNERRLDCLNEADVDEIEGLDMVAQFFAKTIDRLAKNLAFGKKTRIELFDGLRQVLIQKIDDQDLKYLCTHVGELLESHEFDIQKNDRLKQKMAPLEEFFDKEVKIIEASNREFVEIEDFENFQNSAIYQDEFGNNMVEESVYSSAMFLRMYAHENYARFQLALQNQFSDKLAENWKITNDFKKNAVKIWQQITNYEAFDLEKKIQKWCKTVFYSYCILTLIATTIAVLVGLLMFGERVQHLQKQTVLSLPFSLTAILFAAIYIRYRQWELLEKAQSFDNVKDLMRGSIETDITELMDAYKHFKATPGISMTHINDELREFQKVTVNYLYNDTFYGEMEFRCREFSPTYYAIEFMSNVEEARRPIEVLQVLNSLEYFMSLNDYFENNRNKGKVTYEYNPQKIETEHADLNVLDNDEKIKERNAEIAFEQAKAMGQDGIRGREVRYVLPKRPKKNKYQSFDA